MYGGKKEDRNLEEWTKCHPFLLGRIYIYSALHISPIFLAKGSLGF